MRIQVTTGSSVPIYRQVADQIRHAAATERMAVGESLPSVRALASQLVVNPNTIAKAFAALVRDGVIESRQGRGYFVTQRRDIYTRKERQRRLEEILDPFLAEALTLGYDPPQIVAEVDRRLKQMSKAST